MHWTVHAVTLHFLFCAALSAQNISYFRSYGAAFGEQGNVVVHLSNGHVATGMQLSDPFGGGNVHPGLLVTDGTGAKVFCKKYPAIPHPSAVQHLIRNNIGFLLAGVNWFMQVDHNGDVIWYRTVSTNNSFTISDMKAVDNGYIVVGKTQPSTSGYAEIAIVKLDLAGQMVWSKQIFTDNYQLHSLKVIPRGHDLFVAGTGKLNLLFLDVFMMRLDSAANPIWTKHFDTQYDDELADFLLDDQGRFYLIGRNYGAVSGSDVFLIRTDEQGEVLDTRHFNGANGDGDEKTRCATLLDNGTLAISFDHGGSSDRSPAVLSLNQSDLSINWCRTYAYEPQFTNYVLDIIPAPDHGLIMVGDMHVIGKIRDTYLIRTLPNGDAQCYTFRYGMTTVQQHFDDSLIIDSSLALSLALTDMTVVAEETIEVVEFIACEHISPLANFASERTTTLECEEVCFSFTDSSTFFPAFWQWTFTGGTPSSFIGPHPPEVCWNENGGYEVTLTVHSRGGSHTSARIIEVDLDCALVIPNVFSPNGDGVNDTFRIGSPPAQFELTIHNRWGQILFQTLNKHHEWTGANENTGLNVPAGVYFYELVDLTKERRYTGHVQLLR